jgi:hypothetical protein
MTFGFRAAAMPYQRTPNVRQLPVDHAAMAIAAEVAE